MTPLGTSFNVSIVGTVIDYGTKTDQFFILGSILKSLQECDRQ